MEEKLIIESLSPIERNLLPKISKEYEEIEEIAKKANQDKTTALRALAFLKNKGLVEEKTKEKNQVILGILGINYSKKELPERILLNKLVEKRNIPINEIKNVTGLNDNEAKVALGIIKNKALA